MKCTKCGHDDSKLNLLKMELKEINQRVKEAEVEHSSILKMLNYVKDLDPANPKVFKVQLTVLKESNSAELEKLRSNIDLIRKISSESADLLELELNRHEQRYRNNMEFLQKMAKPDFWQKTPFSEIVQSILSIYVYQNQINLMVTLCKNCIRDAIKKIE